MTTENHAALEMPFQREFVITRDFDARPSRVFRAWTEPHRLEQWWMRKGFSKISFTIEP